MTLEDLNKILETVLTLAHFLIDFMKENQAELQADFKEMGLGVENGQLKNIALDSELGRIELSLHESSMAGPDDNHTTDRILN